MLLEKMYAPFFLSALPDTVCEIFTVEMCIILDFIVKKVKVKCKFDNRKGTCDIVCVGNRNVCSICHCLLDNHA